MGDAIILNRQKKSYKLPVLKSTLPANVTLIESASGKASFSIGIETDGYPNVYTYQWYWDDSPISGATSSTYTTNALTSATNFYIYCEVTNKAGTVRSRTATVQVKSSQPSYTYSGEHTLTKQNTYDWLLTLKTSGTLKFTSLGNASTVDMFQVGGGGAGAKPSSGSGGAAAGGGGAYRTVNSITPSLNTNYTITIGAGGDTNGEAGGATSALGYSSNGGGGATAGSASYALVNTCSSSGSSGNLYKYGSLSSNTTVSLGSGYHDIYLKYPYQSTKHSNGVTVYLGTDEYWYRTNEVYFTLKTIYNSNGTAGSGSSATKVFGSGDTVSGPGGTNNATNRGQGGGTSGIVGGNGLVAIRNHR